LLESGKRGVGDEESGELVAIVEFDLK